MDELQEPESPNPSLFIRATESVRLLRQHLPADLQHPKIAIVCGSGLGGLAETIESSPRIETAYENIPGFPKSTGTVFPSQTLVLERTWNWREFETSSTNGEARVH